MYNPGQKETEYKHTNYSYSINNDQMNIIAEHENKYAL